MSRGLRATAASFLLAGLACGPTSAPPEPMPSVDDAALGVASRQREIDVVLAELLAPPAIATAPGFTATVLVPPGELYDPLTMIPRGDVVWVNDDGGTGPKGRFWAIDPLGNPTVLVAAERVNPTTGFDIAPRGFGDYEGQIFALAQQEFYPAGARLNHVVQRIDPESTDPAEDVCVLPTHGSVNDGVAGVGLEVRFGPVDSPFAGRLFSLTVLNGTIYETSADGACMPFVTFDRQPWGFAFSADGSRMLVALRAGGPLGAGLAATGGGQREGAIVSVYPDGTIDPTPVVTGLRVPTDVEIAPPDFGPYGGDIFFLDWETTNTSAPLDEPLTGTASLYRVDTEDQTHQVASGFVRPAGLAFVDGSIWVSNINRDRVDMPEGSIIRIDIAP